ncbi:hypothetical protein DWX08_06505 [Ruminococcus sp. AF18-22]|nr:hypothetical protein DWX08_06505 [Ruminococcus sp. AF18-22]
MQPPTQKRKGLVPMYVTYSDLFTFVIMLVASITLVITINKHNKKQRLHPQSVALFCNTYLPI